MTMHAGGLRRLQVLSSFTVFVFLLAISTSAFAKDVWLYKITKGIQYQQTTPGAPVVLLENGYVFQANVFMPLPGTVRGATVRSQEGTLRVLTASDDDELEFRNRVNTKSTLETRYPDGNFTFTIDTVHDGNKNIVLQLLGNNYPAAPHVSNFAEVQNVNAKGYLIVRWDPMPGGTWADFIQLRIENAAGTRVFETPDLNESGALDGTATFAVIDPDTLKPGTTYEATLRFERNYARDQTSYLGALGWTTYHSLTRFSIVTSSAGKPDVESYEVSKGRGFEQKNAGPPTEDPGDIFLFRAKITASAPGAVLGASLGQTAFEADSDNEEFDISDSAADVGELNTKYPNGLYAFNIQTASQGAFTLTLALNGDLYPPSPHLQYDPSEQVRADQDLGIPWDAWPDGTANDYIQLRVEDDSGDKVFDTDDFGKNGALNGRATFAAVPRGELKPGRTYHGRLTFRRFSQLDTTASPGSLGMASYFARLKFNIKTAPPDVSSFEISKGAEYRQSSATVVTPTQYIFDASVLASGAEAVTSATLTTPRGTVIPLTPLGDGQNFAVKDSWANQSALDAAYPDGNYVLTINTVHDGVRTLSIPLVGGGYANPPRLNSFAYYGQVEPWFDLAPSWDEFIGGTLDDVIRFEVVGPTGAPVFRSDGLTGFHTETFIPSDTLVGSMKYEGSVVFEKVLPVDTTSYPEIHGRANYSARTRFSVITVGPGNPANLNSLQFLPDGNLQFALDSVVGGSYQIEGSSDLKTWTPLGTVNATDFSAAVALPRPSAPAYFFRAILLR